MNNRGGGSQGRRKTQNKEARPKSTATQNPHLSRTRTICFLTGYGAFRVSANTQKHSEGRWALRELLFDNKSQQAHRGAPFSDFIYGYILVRTLRLLLRGL